MKISIVLLLLLIAFCIYCLMKPSSEDFTNNTIPVKETKKTPLSVNDNVISQELINSVLQESENHLKNTHQDLEGDDGNQQGANFEEAFGKALVDPKTASIVDLNKNNVKNYNAKDYLPKEINNDWFDTDFSQAKHKINDDKLINTEKYVIGINTVGQSLKNASYDIRGAVNVPKYSVSPWQNSTIEPDNNIAPLC